MRDAPRPDLHAPRTSLAQGILRSGDPFVLFHTHSPAGEAIEEAIALPGSAARGGISVESCYVSFMAANTIIETGTPEELAEWLARRAPSLARGRYRLVVQPEPDRETVAAQLEVIFRELDAMPDPQTEGMTDEQVMAHADAVIAAVRRAERAKSGT